MEVGAKKEQPSSRRSTCYVRISGAGVRPIRLRQARRSLDKVLSPCVRIHSPPHRRCAPNYNCSISTFALQGLASDLGSAQDEAVPTPGHACPLADVSLRKPPADDSQRALVFLQVPRKHGHLSGPDRSASNSVYVCLCPSAAAFTLALNLDCYGTCGHARLGPLLMLGSCLTLKLFTDTV